MHAEPGSQRCFESEESRLDVWAVAETADVAVDLTIEAVDGMRLETVEPAAGSGTDGDRHRRQVGPVSDRGPRESPCARRAVAGHRHGRRRQCVRVPAGATAIHRDPTHRTARPPRHPPDSAHRAGRRVCRCPPIRARRPVAHGQLAGQRAARQPARHGAADRPRRRRRGADRRVSAAAGSGDRSNRPHRARRGTGRAERVAQR